MSLPAMNKTVVLAERPGRGSITQKTFKKDAVPLKKPADGELVVKVELLSIVCVIGILACLSPLRPPSTSRSCA